MCILLFCQFCQSFELSFRKQGVTLGNADRCYTSNITSMKYDKRLLSDDKYLFANFAYEDPWIFF